MKRPSAPVRQPTLGESLVPVAALMLFLVGAVVNRHDLPSMAVVTPVLQLLAQLPLVGGVLEVSIPVQIPLALATVVAGLMAWRGGASWSEIQRGLGQGLQPALGSILILLVVGALIGVWIASGVVPMLIAVAEGLGVPLAMAAGAIVSGAYFGDKMSPLSETTNLAPGIVGVDLFTHIRHMMMTTGPSIGLALLLFLLLGRGYRDDGGSASEVTAYVSGLEQAVTMSGWLWLPPLLVLGLVGLRVPALPALVAGVAAGGMAAMLLQGESLAQLLIVAYDGYAAHTGNAAIDTLLTRGGMSSMYGTIGIIIWAMCFGGIMERSGMLGRLAEAILSVARTRARLVAATLATSLGINLAAADQYLSIIVPGRMYRPAYARMGLEPKNLSRCLEDGGTLTSPLVPWNSCGAYMFATLGVFPLAYLPFAFFNLSNFAISLICGITGWTMTRTVPESGHTES